MMLAHDRRLTPFVLLFALLQALSPAMAAVADGWRVDERTPYAHVESETSSGCVVVHQHDCALCSVALVAGLPADERGPLPPLHSHVGPAGRDVRAPSPCERVAPSQRAPPMDRA